MDEQKERRLVGGVDYTDLEMSKTEELGWYWLNSLTGITVKKGCSKDLMTYAKKNSLLEPFNKATEKEKRNIVILDFLLFTMTTYMLMFLGFTFKWWLFLLGIGLYIYASSRMPTPFHDYPITEVKHPLNKLNLSTRYVYYEVPLIMYEYFNEFERSTGSKIRPSGTMYLDRSLGLILEITLENSRKVAKVHSLNDPELVNLFLVPMINEYSKTEARYISNGKAYIQIDQLLRSYSGETVDMRQLFAGKQELIPVFKELKSSYEKMLAEKEAIRVRENKQKFIAKINQRLKMTGIENEMVLNILVRLYDKKEVFGFGPHMIDGGLRGNNRYFTARMVFNKNGNAKKVVAMQTEIEKVVGRAVMVKELANKGSFDMTVILKPDLPSFVMKPDEVIETYNKNNEIFLGDSLTGHLSANLGDGTQANFFGVYGKSGSGKSVNGVNLAFQLLNTLELNKNNQIPTETYIFSSSKAGDFAELKKAGAAVLVGKEYTVKLLEYLVAELMSREKMFEEVGVGNIIEWNDKFSNNTDKQMAHILLIGDEVENAIQDSSSLSESDKRKAGNTIEDLLIKILNIARSSGMLAILMGQNFTKEKGFKGVRDKITNTISGFNDTNILNTLSPDISSYYKTLTTKPQGVFFYDGLNMKPKQETLTFGETSFTLLQTPYIKGITTEWLPEITGGNRVDAILGIDSVTTDDSINPETFFKATEVSEFPESEEAVLQSKEIIDSEESSIFDINFDEL